MTAELLGRPRATCPYFGARLDWRGVSYICCGRVGSLRALPEASRALRDRRYGSCCVGGAACLLRCRMDRGARVDCGVPVDSIVAVPR